MSRSLLMQAVVLAALVASSSAAQYCTATVSAPCGGAEYISNVQLTSLTKASTCAAGGATGYENYTAFTAPLQVGVPATISVTVAAFYPGDAVSVFIDWNGNTSFVDSGETFVLTQGATGANVVFTGVITPPVGAVASTRMRVRMAWPSSPAPTSCGVTTYGNVEDYTVTVAAAPAAVWQANQPGASFDLDGVQGTAYAKAVVNRTADNVCDFGPATAHLNSTNVGQPWDLGVTGSYAVPVGGGGGTLTDGQRINLLQSDPSLFFLNGFAFTTPFPGNFSFVHAPGAPFQIAAQMVVVDPAQATSVSLSQPVDRTVTLASAPAVPTLTGDDVAVAIPLGAFPGLGACTFTFFGVTYSQIYATTNGRFTFGTPDTGFTPTTFIGAAGAPFAGAWVDLDQTLGGSVNFTSPGPGLLKMAYAAVPYWGNAGIPTTWSVQLNTTTGAITLVGLAGLPAFPAGGASNTMMLGLSPGGAAGATDPGSHVFTLGANTAPALATSMFYEIGTAGTLAGHGTGGAVNTLVFTPAGSGNYSASGS